MCTNSKRNEDSEAPVTSRGNFSSNHFRQHGNTALSCPKQRPGLHTALAINSFLLLSICPEENNSKLLHQFIHILLINVIIFIILITKLRY